MEDNFDLVKYISVDKLQDIQDSFCALIGMSANISDENGSAITIATAMSDFCKYTRVSRIGAERCRKCDSEGAERAFREGKPVCYTCHAGLTDFVAPIVIDGKRVGCFVGGQVRLGELDEEKVRQTAKDIGVNPEMYLALAGKTQMISQDTLEKSMDFIYNVTLSISDMAYKQYQIEKAKDEVEYAAKLKSDFLANMSHEMKTPMNGVIGIADIALRDDIPEKTREYLGQIRSSGKKMLSLINDILDFSKLESGNMTIINEEYEVRNIYSAAESIVKQAALEKNLKLNFELSSDIPNVLIGDSTRIGQVLLNLVSNSIKFTQEGQVTVRFETVEKSDEDIKLKISVSDTGIGIAKDDQKKLFQSFNQIDSKRNRQAEGTGIGLAISKLLVELMGGQMGFESVLGEGSTFWFTLCQKLSDKDRLENEEELLEAALSFVAPEAQVLIVDDNEVNLAVAAGVLAPLNMKIDKALSGKKALEMITEKQYDLIFMDHMMPEMDGIETTAIIKNSYPEYGNVPIIALTANTAEGSREMYLKEGMSGCVTKPIDYNTIVTTLYKWLPNERIVRAERPVKEVLPKSTLKIEGLDTVYALKLLGTEQLYMSVLKDYYRVIDTKASLIEKYFDNEDWKNYTIDVHALKSASRQIGALELADLAYEMEKAGNAGDVRKISSKTDKMLEMYRQYIDILKPMFYEPEKELVKVALNTDAVKEYLKQLTNAIEELDMDAMNEAMEMIVVFSFSEELQKVVDMLQESVDNLDVDSAAEYIENLEILL